VRRSAGRCLLPSRRSPRRPSPARSRRCLVCVPCPLKNRLWPAKAEI